MLARGACLRFLLTRAWDWLNTPADALVVRKDPLAYLRRLDWYERGNGLRDRTGNVEIVTDGACKGNPGPGGWGAVIRVWARRKRNCRAASR